jgi:hypothetical protein
VRLQKQISCKFSKQLRIFVISSLPGKRLKYFFSFRMFLRAKQHCIAANVLRASLGLSGPRTRLCVGQPEYRVSLRGRGKDSSLTPNVQKRHSLAFQHTSAAHHLVVSGTVFKPATRLRVMQRSRVSSHTRCPTRQSTFLESDIWNPVREPAVLCEAIHGVPQAVHVSRVPHTTP